MTQEEEWRSAIDECTELYQCNRWIVPLMKERGEAFKTMAAAEAKRRGYRPDKIAGVYLPPVQMNLTKGRNIIKVGWSGGTLYATFASSGRIYPYPGAPQEWAFALLRSPYPDGLWAKYKAKWELANASSTQSKMETK